MKIDKEHIISSLKKDKSLLQNEMGVKNLALFGSYAQNSQTEESDIDFLIELKEINYKQLFNMYSFLEKKFPGKKIQLTRKGPHLSQKFLNTIERDLIYV
ncbi:MAG: nucleotidyltransferase domain-containing protein [Bacteroidota bacterium]|nr:nucleotidyltransferase domain-containing protein [Bacteroidota bacterium]